MIVLITGGAGFIGYHLAKRLVREGHEVTAVDNFNDDYDKALKEARSASLQRMGVYVRKSEFHEGPMRGCDLIVHLAAHAHVRDSMTRQVQYVENNVVKTQKMIDRISERISERPTPLSVSNYGYTYTTPARIIYASTSCVAAGQPLPWREDEPVRHQLNPYGYTKYVNECQFRMSGLNATGLRFFTVYGPWGRPDMALFNFTRDIILGRPITVFNEGMMKRDFTYIDDIIDGIMLTIHNGPQTGSDHVFNIGRGQPVELMDFVRIIEEKVGKKAIINKAPRHPADTLETWSNTDKLKALGYDPKVSITEGVGEFINWFRSYYDC